MVAVQPWRRVLVAASQLAPWFRVRLRSQVHRAALSALCLDNHIWFAFAFLYAFPHVVALVIPWAPPWAPICLWYAFLVELFATQGPTAVVVTARVVLPLLFLLEGLSHHSFLLDLTGAYGVVWWR